MKYKTTLEVTAEQVESIVKAHFEKQGKNVESLKFVIKNRHHSDGDGGWNETYFSNCDVVIFIEDGK